MTEKFRLTAGETNTDVWRRLRAHTEGRLADARKRAEGLALDERDRRDLLVRIDELKKFLALGEPAPDKPTNAG
jgi:hypothetical protein